VVIGKIVRAKSKFKAAPERLGIGAAVCPIYTESPDRRRGDQPVGRVFAEPPWQDARRGNILCL